MPGAGVPQGVTPERVSGKEREPLRQERSGVRDLRRHWEDHPVELQALHTVHSGQAYRLRPLPSAWI